MYVFHFVFVATGGYILLVIIAEDDIIRHPLHELQKR